MRKARNRPPRPEPIDTGAVKLMGNRTSTADVVRLIRPTDGAVFEMRVHVVDGQPARHARNVTPDPLDYYATARMLSDDEDLAKRRYAAGARLRRDFQGAAIERISKMRYLDVRFGSPEGTDRQQVARLRFTKAITAVSPVSMVYLWDVCCFGKWAKDVAHSLGAPDRYGIVRFREALDELRAFYDGPSKRNPPPLTEAG
ncbi:MAG: DUF6456 domain-containing protein [Gemmatimonadota bacterium]